VQSVLILLPELRFGIGQIIYESLACSFVERIGDLRVIGRKELLLLQLYPLPWRISQNNIKATMFALLVLIEDLGELQMPVEEVMILCYLSNSRRQGIFSALRPKPSYLAVVGSPVREPSSGKKNAAVQASASSFSLWNSVSF